MNYEFLADLDELPLYSAVDCGNAIGLDRKVFASRAKRMRLGEERELTENVSNPRLYFSVDDCVRIFGMGNTKRIRGLIRTNLIEMTTNTLIETTKRTHRPKPQPQQKKLDYEQIRKGIGDSSWSRKMRDYGVLTLDEVKSVFGLTPDDISTFKRIGGFSIGTDGKNMLVEVNDIITTLDIIFTELNKSYRDELKTTIPLTEGFSYSNSVIQISQFMNDRDYRTKVLSLITKTQKKADRILR